MIKRKISFAIATAFFLLSCLPMTSCTKTVQRISEASDYLVIHSRSKEQASGMYCINEKGEITEKFKNGKMQDLSFFQFNNERLLISGGRRNNNMLFPLDDNGHFETLHWLNEANYSGVTAIALLENSALAIMNGNYTETTYLNLLVEQDFQGKIIQQNTLEIYARDISVSNNCANVAGKHLLKDTNSNIWNATIVSYNLKNHQMDNQYDYADFNCFWQIVENETSLFCLSEDKSETINTVCIINKQTFDIEAQIKIDDQLNSINIINEKFYVVGDKAIYEITKADALANTALSFTTTESGFVDWAYVYNGHYYVFFRHAQRIKKKNAYEYGYLFKIDLGAFEKIDIPIYADKWTTMDDILIFPTTMFNQ